MHTRCYHCDMKLHVGCGDRIIPGWVHVDARDLPHVDHVAPVDRLTFCANDSVKVVYASHVLEHFARAEVPRVLREWHRVLSPGGTLRLAVPNFEALCDVYLRTGSLQTIIGPLYGRQDYLLNHHHNTFDHATLVNHLEAVGFVSCRAWDWRLVEHGHIDDYSQSYIPHMAKDTGQLISLNVEATKRG